MVHAEEGDVVVEADAGEGRVRLDLRHAEDLALARIGSLQVVLAQPDRVLRRRKPVRPHDRRRFTSLQGHQVG